LGSSQMFEDGCLLPLRGLSESVPHASLQAERQPGLRVEPALQRASCNRHSTSTRSVVAAARIHDRALLSYKAACMPHAPPSPRVGHAAVVAEPGLAIVLILQPPTGRGDAAVHSSTPALARGARGTTAIDERAPGPHSAALAAHRHVRAPPAAAGCLRCASPNALDRGMPLDRGSRRAACPNAFAASRCG
jgi:hypothetical protein